MAQATARGRTDTTRGLGFSLTQQIDTLKKKIETLRSVAATGTRKAMAMTRYRDPAGTLSWARSVTISGISAVMVLMAARLPAQESNTRDSGLAEVLVTAQKKEESLQKAAVAVTALPGAEIATSGIKDPIEIENSLPAVLFQEATTPVMVIRGVGTYNNQPGVDSAVAYTVDGTYLSHHPALMPVLFDIDHVEAVRGPQGTLYGRNSNGGALNISTNWPVLRKFGASAAVSVGNYSAIGSELVLNAPLGERSALRVALANDKHDPYFKDG